MQSVVNLAKRFVSGPVQKVSAAPEYDKWQEQQQRDRAARQKEERELEQRLSQAYGQLQGVRVVLIGTTGAGKSTLGNLLLHNEPGNQVVEDPNFFRVSAGGFSCTREAKSLLRGDFKVCDTPGLGDVPSPAELVSGYNEENKDLPDFKPATGGNYNGDPDYKSYSRRVADSNSNQYFATITEDLHEQGGLVVFVYNWNGRLTQKSCNHVQALKQVLNEQLGPHTVMVITHVHEVHCKDPDAKVTIDDWGTRQQVQVTYAEWLQHHRSAVEGQTGVRFDTCIGISASQDVRSNHPAHYSNVLGALAYQVSQEGVLKSGQCMRWKDVCEMAKQSCDDKDKALESVNQNWKKHRDHQGQKQKAVDGLKEDLLRYYNEKRMLISKQQQVKERAKFLLAANGVFSSGAAAAAAAAGPGAAASLSIPMAAAIALPPVAVALALFSVGATTVLVVRTGWEWYCRHKMQELEHKIHAAEVGKAFLENHLRNLRTALDKEGEDNETKRKAAEAVRASYTEIVRLVESM